MPRKKTKKVEETKKTISSKTPSKTTPFAGAKELFFRGTGKRKTSIAQVRLYQTGKGQILINNKKLEEYFPYFAWQETAKAPFFLVDLKDYKITAHVAGGGINSQAEAVRLGISRALVAMNPDFRSVLKKAKFLTRDARVKERKKPGLKRARRAPQWAKR